MEMASPSGDSSKQADPENFRLSSLDEDSRPSSKLLEQKDEELGLSEDGLLPIQEEAKPKRSGGMMMLVWILVNTFATIGIVSIACPAGKSKQADMLGWQGIRQQSPLRRSTVQTRTTELRNVPLRSDNATTLPAVTAEMGLLRGQKGQDNGNAAISHIFLSPGCLTKLLTRLFLRRLLPDGAGPTNTIRCSHQLFHLQAKYPQDCSLHPDPGLSWSEYLIIL